MKQMKLWMWAVALTCGVILTSCSNDDVPVEPTLEDKVEEQLRQMTLLLPSGPRFVLTWDTQNLST